MLSTRVNGTAQKPRSISLFGPHQPFWAPWGPFWIFFCSHGSYYRIRKLIFQKLIEGSNNLFLDPVQHFVALWWPFWIFADGEVFKAVIFSKWGGIPGGAGGERVGPVQLSRYFKGFHCIFPFRFQGRLKYGLRVVCCSRVLTKL